MPDTSARRSLTSVDVRGAFRTYDAVVAAQIPLLSGSLVGYFAMLAILHPLLFDEVPSRLVTSLAVASTGIALAVTIRTRAHPIAPALAHPVVVALIALALLDSAVHGFSALEANETVTCCLILVVTGLAVLDRRWLVGTVVGTWLSWGCVTVAIGGTDRSWSEWAFFLGSATMLGAVSNVVRRSAIDTSTAALDAAVRAATEDQLTGLSNRRGLALLGAELVGVARRSNEPVHCSFLDVDGLKAVNDTCGHEVGDEVIAAVARALRAITRGPDVVARWGGDEFVLIGLGPGVPVETLEERIRSHLAEHSPDNETVSSRRISIGRVVRAPWEVGGLELLIEAADRDMYLRRSQRGHPSLVPFSAHDHSLGVAP